MLSGEYVTATPIPGTALVPIATGIDLTDAYRIELSISQGATGQAASSSALFRDIELDSDTGALFHWWNDDFIRLRVNSADITTGDIALSAHGTTGFVVESVTVWKLAQTGATPTNNLAVPKYADDTAAIAAGLTAGQIYALDGSAAAPYNVPGMVVVVQ